MLAYYPDRSSPFLVKFGSRGVTRAAAYVRAGGRATAREGLPNASRVGGHWESGAAALLKAVWWDMRLASLLTHFFRHRQHHQLHAHNAEEQIIHSKRLVKNC